MLKSDDSDMFWNSLLFFSYFNIQLKERQFLVEAKTAFYDIGVVLKCIENDCLLNTGMSIQDKVGFITFLAIWTGNDYNPGIRRYHTHKTWIYELLSGKLSNKVVEEIKKGLKETKNAESKTNKVVNFVENQHIYVDE